MTSRKKPGVAFWATVALIAVLVYILSAPPLQHKILPADSPRWMLDALSAIYWPAQWIVVHSPEPIQRAFLWYASLWR